MSAETLYAKLCVVATTHESAGYLSAYQKDLHVHDKRVLKETAEPGVHYVWILRDHGTELFEIASGRDPAWLTHWTRNGKCLAFLLDHDLDTVTPLTIEEADRLANVPHPEGFKQVWKGLS